MPSTSTPTKRKLWLENDDPLMKKIPFETQAKSLLRRPGSPIPNSKMRVGNATRFYERVQLERGPKERFRVYNAARKAYFEQKEAWREGRFDHQPLYEEVQRAVMLDNGYLGDDGEFQWWLDRYQSEIDAYRGHVNKKAEQIARTCGVNHLELGPSLELEPVEIPDRPAMPDGTRVQTIDPKPADAPDPAKLKERNRRAKKARWRRSDLPDDIAWVASRPCLLPERQAMKDEDGNLPPLTRDDFFGAPSPQAQTMLGWAYYNVDAFMKQLFGVQVSQWSKVKPIEAEQKKKAAEKGQAAPPEDKTVETAGAQAAEAPQSELLAFLAKQLEQYTKQPQATS